MADLDDAFLKSIHTNADVTLIVYTQPPQSGNIGRTNSDRVNSVAAFGLRVGNELFNIVHPDEGSQELSRCVKSHHTGDIFSSLL